jgi:hypothetical protein
MTIEEFLKERCEKVRSNESDAHIELMMDNHKCIEYGNKQYYVPEDGNLDDEEVIYEFLIENYLL